MDLVSTFILTRDENQSCKSKYVSEAGRLSY